MAEARERYLAYLAALNERRFQDLADFVAEELTYNGRPMTRGEYQDARRDDVDVIPDVRFEVGLLVVEGDRVASVLEFDCTPAKTFLGLAPTGRRIRFDEHVFYRFSEGQIVEVRSLIDREAIREQASTR
jgi:predicted ester cyclase